MGLIRSAAGVVRGITQTTVGAGAGAAGGAFADQWKEYFYCESIPSEVLVTKGVKRTGGRSANTKGTDNIISQGSVIAVADGQCMIIVDQGKVAELCAEPGEFIYDNTSEPTIMNGKLSETIHAVFKDIGKRFAFGGEPPRDQRVYYFNTKEIFGNKYGTPTPVPFRVVDPRSGLDMDVDIRCSGEYSYRVSNPILFYTNICGNVPGDFRRDGEFGEMMKKEVVKNLRPALARISALGIRYSELPAHEDDLCAALKELLNAEWDFKRGIEMVSFTMPNAAISDEHMKIIREFQQRAVLTNTNMAAATLVNAQADAMKAAANNESGAMTGFMGMGMAQQAGGFNAQNLFQMNQQQAPAPAPSAPAGWACSCGYTGNNGKFCSECAKPKPSDDFWTCSCGTANKGKFCSECAKPRPSGAVKFKCDKCGWVPEDPAKPPKFCPECADPFNEADIQQ